MRRPTLPWGAATLLGLVLAAPAAATPGRLWQDPERTGAESLSPANQDPQPAPAPADPQFVDAMQQLLVLLEQSAAQQDAVRAQLQRLTERLRQRPTGSLAAPAGEVGSGGMAGRDATPSAGEWAALRERVTELEAQQLETATIVNASLQQTAARLDSWSQILASLEPGSPGPSATVTEDSASPGLAAGGPMMQEPGGLQPWVLGVLMAGVLVIGMLTWRFQRERRHPLPTDNMPPEEGVPAEEVWGVAHLLSDAVGKMRGSSAEPTIDAAAETTEAAVESAAEPLAEPPTAGSGAVSDGELRVPLDEDQAFGGARALPVTPDEDEGIDAGEAFADLVLGPGSSKASPAELEAGDSEPAAPRWQLRFTTANPERIEPVLARFLAADLRVLREPEPVLRSSGDSLEIECSLLPGLLDAEREQFRLALERLVGSGSKAAAGRLDRKKGSSGDPWL